MIDSQTEGLSVVGEGAGLQSHTWIPKAQSVSFQCCRIASTSYMISKNLRPDLFP
jgi:hypothetical protein